MRRRPTVLAAILTGLPVILAVTVLTGIAPSPAAAGTRPAAVAGTRRGATVSADPVDNTPHIQDGTVRAIAVVGDTVVVGGDFTSLTDAGRRRWYERDHLFAYNLRTGRVLSFAPELDGPVYALAAGPGGTVYVGGNFSSVDGVAQNSLARLYVDTGEQVPGFDASLDNGDVRALAAVGPWLYAGGTFGSINGTGRAAVARLSDRTGDVDPNFDLHLAAPNLGRPKVEDLAISPNGSRLVVVGAIAQAGAQYRAQLALADTSGSVARLANWWTDTFATPCSSNFDTYLRAVDFSPDGSYFVTVTTGRAPDPARPCDSAARFNVSGTGAHRPVWVNRTGGDSLYSVLVTGSAVYVGGHQRWMDNPFGNESAGPGAVSRTGIAALDPVTGRALPWNPTRSRGVGVRAMAYTPAGLIVGSDTDQLGHEYHARIGMFPPSGR
ncbi:MAG: hypothetical protein QOE03_3982 [Micromonosporaceae bacterium]|jgi:hypothetical protein|nr:hypothetical protein [Micromonosporaceae bacterium]